MILVRLPFNSFEEYNEEIKCFINKIFHLIRSFLSHLRILWLIRTEGQPGVIWMGVSGISNAHRSTSKQHTWHYAFPKGAQNYLGQLCDLLAHLQVEILRVFEG